MTEEEEEEEEIRKIAKSVLEEREKVMEERARVLAKAKAGWTQLTDKKGRTVPAYRGMIITEDAKKLEDRYPLPYGKKHLTLTYAYDEYKSLVKKLDECVALRSNCKSNLEDCLKRLPRKA